MGMSHHQKAAAAALAIVVAFGSGCGESGSSSPAPVSPTPVVTLAGTYAGPMSDSTGSGRSTWVVSQAGTAISGSARATTALGTVAFDGALTGTLSGTTLTFTVSIPVGGISAFPGCSATISGTATGVTAAQISGSYSGTNSCTGSFDRGVLALSKQ